MKLNYRLLAGAAMLIALAGACSKKYNNPNSVEPNVMNPFGGPPGSLTPGSQLNKLFKDLRSVPEKICVTAGILQTISFSKGTVLTFYPHSFKYKSGQLVTNEEVCLEVIEMYNPGSMIANRATTMSDEGLLQSGGQVYIKATKNGEEVFANVYGIGFKQTASTKIPMQLFYGNTNNRDSLVTWIMADITKPGTARDSTTPIVPPTPPLPPPPPFDRYFFDSCTDFNLVNCDRLQTDPTAPKSTIYIYLPDKSYTEKNTEVFVVVPSRNAVVSGSNVDFADTNSLIYTPGHYWDDHHHIPIGMEVTIVTLTKKNDTYYYYEQPGVIVTKDIKIHTAPEAKSVEFIKARLSEL